MQHSDEAVLYLIEVLRRGGARGGYSNYGYDLYIPNAIREYVALRVGDPDRGDGYTMQQTLSPFFLDAAWELARRGIIRPGIRSLREQSTDEGSAGAGWLFSYSLRQKMASRGDAKHLGFDRA